tara:strand:+ start:398 stop:634 length:237 start_codon:yes stop_codon:yes gene_type:complete
MNIGPLLLMLVITTTILINYLNNRCPKCKKWQFKGFNRVDEETAGELVTVYCPRCSHKWSINYKKSEFQPTNETTTRD